MKKVYGSDLHLALTQAGHTLMAFEDGRLDIFAYDEPLSHNGPRCSTCGVGWCHHCGLAEIPPCEAEGHTKEDLAMALELAVELDEEDDYVSDGYASSPEANWLRAKVIAALRGAR